MENSIRIEDHYGLVMYLASNMAGGMPDSIEYQDLYQEGVIALMGAIETYDSEQGATFKTYLRIRATGAMLDYVRRQTPVSKGVYATCRESESVRHNIEQSAFRPARDTEVASAMDMSIDRLHMFLCKRDVGHLLSIDNDMSIMMDKAQVDPSDSMASDSLTDALSAAIGELSTSNQELIKDSYYEGNTLAEIAIKAGVSESMICVRRKGALKKLRVKLRDYDRCPANKSKPVIHKPVAKHVAPEFKPKLAAVVSNIF